MLIRVHVRIFGHESLGDLECRLVMLHGLPIILALLEVNTETGVRRRQFGQGRRRGLPGREAGFPHHNGFFPIPYHLVGLTSGSVEKPHRTIADCQLVGDDGVGGAIAIQPLAHLNRLNQMLSCRVPSAEAGFYIC